MPTVKRGPGGTVSLGRTRRIALTNVLAVVEQSVRNNGAIVGVGTSTRRREAASGACDIEG